MNHPLPVPPAFSRRRPVVRPRLPWTVLPLMGALVLPAARGFAQGEPAAGATPPPAAIRPSVPLAQVPPAPATVAAPTPVPGSPGTGAPAAPGPAGTITGERPAASASPSPGVPPPLPPAPPTPGAPAAGLPPGDLAGGPSSALDELGVEIRRRRQAEELAPGGSPDALRTYRNQQQVPLRTLFYSLAQQAQIPYLEPPFPDDPVVAFYAPEAVTARDAFYAAAEAYGYKVVEGRAGFISLERSDIRVPERYYREIYRLRNLNPFFALQPLAQSLGFQVKAPGQNSPSFPSPRSGDSGGGDLAGLLGGGGGGEDQSKPRFTPVLPLDAPIYFRERRGGGGGGAGGNAAGTGEDSFLFLDRKQKAFVLFGSAAEHRQVREYLRGLDTPEKLIKVRTEVYRVNRDRAASLGIDWSESFGTGLRFSVNPNLSDANNLALYPTGLLISYPSVSATLRALVQKGVFRSVASTDILMRDGIPNTIRQVIEDPVALSTGFTGGTSVNTGEGGTAANPNSVSGTTQIKTFYYGLSVDGVAFAMPNGKVDLNLNVNLSNNTGDKATSQGPLPRVQRNTAPVSAVVRPGTTCAFGGLVSGSEQVRRNAIPYLSKIPFLGPAFFSSTQRTFNGDTLVIFTTPWVIEPEETERNPLAPEEQDAMARLRENVGSLQSPEVRRAVPAGDGKAYTPFRRPVTRRFEEDLR